MATFTFSTENLIALNKLESSFRRESGERHVLSEEQSLLKLIACASTSSSVRVQTALASFLASLSVDQKRQLVYRGVVVDKSLADEMPKPAGSRVVAKTYRGVSVVTQIETTKETAHKSEPSKKRVRIYRGRVVADD